MLHPQVPRPLHGIAPRTVLGQTWWDKEQYLCKKRANWCCQVCGVHKLKAKYHKWMEAHETYNINYQTGVMEYVEAVSLCHSCHNFIHRGRMQTLLSKGEMTKSKYKFILERGFRILKENRLVIQSPPKIIAFWNDWRLLVKGKYYSGLTKMEWERKYG